MMKDTFDLKKFISSKQLLKEAEEDNKGIRINPNPTKVTGAVSDEEKPGKFFPQKPKFYLLSSRQLKLLRNWSAGGKLDSPGAKMENGFLYINVFMIPDLEGNRGRGGKYNIRDDIKASYGKDKSVEAMEVLKAINYAIRNSDDKSVSTDGSEYKRIDGKGSWNGYAIYAAPSKEETNEEITNINETKMTDNFDLRKYLGSKRLLTENFEPADGTCYSGNGYLDQDQDDVDLDEIKDEDADEDIDDSKYYKDDDDDIELDDMSNLDDYEMPNEFEWEDDLYENEEPIDDLPDDKLWYGDDEDINIDDMSDLDDYEMPDKFDWEDDLYESEENKPNILNHFKFAEKDANGKYKMEPKKPLSHPLYLTPVYGDSEKECNEKAANQLKRNN